MQSLPTSSHIQEAIEAVLTPPKATALGNYVYIDGGLIAQKVGGQVQPDHYPADPMNSTLSIDISKSWSAETVEFKVTPKTDGPISLRLQAIWNDPNGDAFYIIGGRALYGSRKDELVKDGIWRFSVDGQGGGTWAKEQSSNLDVFQTINLTDGPTFASTYGPSGGIGIAIGGWYDDQTDPNKYNESGWSNTMITYNMNTKIVSTSDMSKVVPPAGYLSLGSAEFVPQFGPNGLVFLMGGASYPSQADGKDASGLDFGNISFYDPEDRKWRWQSTRGNIPARRYAHCTAGIAGPAGTYEM